jgi:predicted RNA-binding Zn ribbon-like protein
MAELELVRDFLNTRDERSFSRHGARFSGDELLATPADLAAWLTEHDLVAAGTAASVADLTDAVALRSALREALISRAAPDIETQPGSIKEPGTVNAVLATFPLRAHLGPAMTPALVPAGQGANAGLAAIVAIVALSAAAGTWDRLKICAAPDCRWVFYDASRNGAGRWCSMRSCGNRDKTRTYRQRQAAVAD